MVQKTTKTYASHKRLVPGRPAKARRIHCARIRALNLGCEDNMIRTVLCLAALALATAASAESYVLVNVRIAHADGTVVENGMILINGDRIVHVGPPVSYEEGFVLVDCAGLTAYPGFIDGYSRSGLDLPDAPENAEARDAVDGPLPSFWHENRKGVYADLDVSQHIDAEGLGEKVHEQGVTAGLLASGRGGFGGLAAVVNLAEMESGQVVLSRAFQEMSFGSSGRGGYPSSLMGRIALMRQIMFDAEHYVANPPCEDEADAVLSAVGDATIGLAYTLFTANTEREIQRAFNLADEFGLRLTLNGGNEAWKHAAELKRRGIDVILDAEIDREPRSEPREDPVRALSDPPLAVLEARHAEWVEDSKFVVKAYEAGLKFAFSSYGDSNSLLENVRKHIGLGLPKAAALRALTIDAAEILGVADQLGSLAEGKLANITLMSGDFADEESVVKTVFVAGKKIDITEEEEEDGR